jgi:hypothetical protein
MEAHGRFVRSRASLAVGADPNRSTSVNASGEKSGSSPLSSMAVRAILRKIVLCCPSSKVMSTLWFTAFLSRPTRNSLVKVLADQSGNLIIGQLVGCLNSGDQIFLPQMDEELPQFALGLAGAEK